jgi:hypothetical protein
VIAKNNSKKNDKIVAKRDDKESDPATVDRDVNVIEALLRQGSIAAGSPAATGARR